MRIVLDSIAVEQGVLQTLSVSSHQYSILMFVYMLILKERKSNEVWGPTGFFPSSKGECELYVSDLKQRFTFNQ
jgi:hypothetical protein